MSIEKTWELHCDLSELEKLTCKVAMFESDELSPDFCAALGEFRKALVIQCAKTESIVEYMARASLWSKSCSATLGDEKAKISAEVAFLAKNYIRRNA